MSLSVIVLAAGQGTRMKSSLPKVLHPVANRPLIGHLFDRLLPLEPAEITVVIQPEATHLREAVTALLPSARFAVQQKQLGTGDAVKAAMDESANTQKTLVLYADHPFIKAETMEALIYQVSTESPVSVLGFEPEDPAKYGRLLMEGDRLHAIREYKDASETEREVRLCNSGVMAFDTAHLRETLPKLSNDNASGEYYLTDMVELTITDGKAASVVRADEDEVMGVNTQAERAKAEAIEQQRLRKRHMDEGVMMVAPETVFFSYDTAIAAGTIVHPHVVFGPKVTISGPAEIKSFSQLEGATIAAGATVGPYARLRPGAALHQNVKVGNFCEIKQATLEEGAKVNHLSYIGDASVGKQANIGAGTITCNYDGKQKYRTEIGEGAFIGSNSSLVAPVSIGDFALIGAGSTVTKDVKARTKMRNEMKQLHFEQDAS